MFGYIVPDKPNMYLKDLSLYRAIYCGICVATGKAYGQTARLATNYDIVFLSALIHNYLGEDISVTERKCALHHIKKRPIADGDEITDKIIAANVLLVYYNLVDDVLDEGGLKKRIAKSRLKHSYKKAKKLQPEMDQAIRSAYERLRNLEKSYCDSVDYLADCFACMMKNIAQIIINKNDPVIDTFSYNFGKWIYLIDAVDDLEKDFKEKQFNPYLVAFKNYRTREQFLADNRSEIDFSLNSTINEIKSSYAKLQFQFNTDLTDNIVYRGINVRTDGILSGEMAGKVLKV